MHGLEIISRDGKTVISLEHEGFTINDIKISVPEQNNLFEDIEGLNGRFHQGSTHTVTQIDVDVEYNLDFELDFPLLRDKLYGLVSSTEPFYIREKRAREHKVLFEVPGERTGEMVKGASEYATGKQYLVLRDGSSTIEKIAMVGSGTITFVTSALPYAESIYTTKEIDVNGVTYDGKWSYGMGLLMEESDRDTWDYTHTTSPFVIYNAGDMLIDDWRMYRVIKITLGAGTSQLKIYDETGNYLQIDRYMYAGDVIILTGPYVYLNGINILNSTNGYYPVIFKGRNTFKITGVSSFTAEFDFKYYYGGTDLTRSTSTVISTPVDTSDKTPPSPPSVENISVGTTEIKGTSEEGATITVTFSNGQVATGVVSIGGSFAVKVPTGVTLATGQSISVTSTDRAGNKSGATTTTVKGYPYSAPTGPSTVKLQSDGETTEQFIVGNLNQAMGKGILWEEYPPGSTVKSFSKMYTITSDTWALTSSNLTDGYKMEFFICDPNTQERLSPSLLITAVAPQQTSTNLWRSSTKDYSSTINSTGNKQITEIFNVIGNNSQQVDVKTTGDTVIVDGDAGNIRFYELTGLKPNTKYTLSYNVSWTDTAQGLHTHAWGVGVLYNASKGSRQKFTFTTNSYGKYGYGNGATMDAPASSILNANHASASGNVTTYSNITLNEGTYDLGYVAGTPTGV